MQLSRNALSLLALLAVAACSGGGATAPPAAGGVQNSATLSITIVVPAKRSSASPRPQFVSPNTQSLVMYAYPSGSSQPATPSAIVNIGGCSGTTTLTCTTSVTAPIGSTTLRIDADARLNGTGSQLATVTTTIAVSVGMAPVQVTLEGTPAIVRLSLETPVLASGTSGTSVLDVNAYDASGSLIVAPGNFSTPLTLTSDSTSVTLSATTATAPGTQANVTYAGGAAPYAVHFSGSGAGIPATSIVGATLVITPPTSFVTLGNAYGSEYQVTMVGSNAGSEPPQVQLFVPAIAGVQNITQGGFGYSGSGAVGIAGYDFTTSRCILGTYPAANLTLQKTITYNAPTDSPYSCSVTGEPSGDLLAGDGIASDDITEYSVSVDGTATATGRSISLVGAQVPTSSVAPIAMATNPTGELAVLASTGTSYYALVYAAAASGATAPLQTIALAGSGSPVAIAIASDGSVAVEYLVSSPLSYRIDRFTTGGALAGSITPQLPLAFPSAFPYGLTMDASANIYALDQLENTSSSTYNYETNIDMFAAGTYGTLTPLATVPLSSGAGVSNPAAGPVVVRSPSPQTAPSPASGDMLAYAPSRTWTYLVTPDNGAQYYVGVYADPNLVSGNIRLVGFQSTTSNPFSGGTLIGSVDFTPLSGSYLAAAYNSPSSGTGGMSGPVPGTPLFVPSSLALNSTWNPMQNVPIANAVGVSAKAQVTFVGSVPGIAGCSGLGGTSGATIRYSVTQAAINYSENVSLSVVPGCGITALQPENGGIAVLQSVGSMPTLGQQSAPAGQSPIFQALHAVWRATLGIRKQPPGTR